MLKAILLMCTVLLAACSSAQLPSYDSGRRIQDPSLQNSFQCLIRHIPVAHRYAAAELSRFVPDKTVIKYFLAQRTLAGFIMDTSPFGSR